jgi:phosphonate transport system ATP-binding protein
MNASVTVANDALLSAEEASLSLCVHHVGKSLGGREVLRDVTFSVRESEFAALLGPSGAGKTTLLRCVSGLTRADEGAITVGGTQVADLRERARRRVAMIFQQFNLVRRFSALENVLAGRLGHVSAWRGIARSFGRSDRLLALECLERVGLLAQATQRVDTLSGGQQQRVAIARALAQQPELIVADEPVASLDPSSGAGVLELLRQTCREQGVAVLCSLHQVRLAREFADRIVGLTGGTVTLDVPVEAFDEAHAHLLYEQDAAPMFSETR